MNTIKAVFLGTPEAAVPSLETLTQIAAVAAVVTRPDRPVGRSKTLRPSPVKVAAQARGLQVIEVGRSSDFDERHLDFDLGVVVAFGALIPRRVLAMSKHGFINVHFSLLPRWRGAAPVATAIAAGDEETGVSIMVLDEGLDTGGVLAASPVVIGDEETAGDLTARLALLGASMLAETIPSFTNGHLAAFVQDETKATYAPRLRSDDRTIDLADTAEHNARKIRSLTPKPGAVLAVDGERLGILAARPSDRELETGRFLTAGDRLLVGSGGRALELISVRPAGRKEMSGSDWARGKRQLPDAEQ